jgi:hypothetical protein
MHDRGHFVSILVEVAHALLSNDSLSLRRKQMFDEGKVLAQLVCLAWIKGRTTISLYAASTFARSIVTSEEDIKNILADDLISYLDHPVEA